jgi:hypothetical protein
VKFDDLKDHHEEILKLEKMLKGSSKGSKKRGGV